jgi:anti-sigma regulatory factor (Ser/Thr protein kinase)
MGELLEFEARADTIGAIRSHVRDSLLHFGCTDEAIDAAVLCTSELATNALVHGDGAIAVEVDLGAKARVTVHDRSRRLPVPQRPDADDDAGRGLLLVGVFADAWGFLPEDPGKAVWFEIDLTERATASVGSGELRRRGDDTDPAGWSRPTPPVLGS